MNAYIYIHIYTHTLWNMLSTIFTGYPIYFPELVFCLCFMSGQKNRRNLRKVVPSQVAKLVSHSTFPIPPFLSLKSLMFHGSILIFDGKFRILHG